jgi:hypothetical protein
MKTFLEYHKEQEIKEFSQWLESQGYDPQTLDLESLLEAGAWEKAKKWGKGAALAGVLGAAALGVIPQGDSNAPLQQQQTQSQSQDAPSQQQVSHEDGVTVEGDTITVRFSHKNMKYSQAKAFDMLAKHLKTDQIPAGHTSGTKKGDDGLWHTTVELSKSGQANAAQARSGMSGSSNIVQPRPGGSLSPGDL